MALSKSDKAAISDEIHIVQMEHDRRGGSDSHYDIADAIHAAIPEGAEYVNVLRALAEIQLSILRRMNVVPAELADKDAMRNEGINNDANNDTDCGVAALSPG